MNPNPLCFKSGLPFKLCGCAWCAVLRAVQAMPYPASPLPIHLGHINLLGHVEAAPAEVVSDIEIGRYALRTFDLRSGTLRSVVKVHAWDSGVAIAQCLGAKGCESPPQEKCSCGIYGTLNLDDLLRQYRERAQRTVAVFAAEGQTIIGSKGLRTAAARIVAYWCADDDDVKAYASCEGAQHFARMDEMLEAFHFMPSRHPFPPQTPNSFIAGMSKGQLDATLKHMRIDLQASITPGGMEAIKHAMGYLGKMEP